jgi:hypothetical protein
VWRRCREAASAGLSAAAPYSVRRGLYSEAFVSSAVALAEVGRFGEAVQYLQKAAKALYEAAKEVFEQVKVTVQRLVELFVEAVTRVLAWVDELGRRTQGLLLLDGRRGGWGGCAGRRV